MYLKNITKFLITGSLIFSITACSNSSTNVSKIDENKSQEIEIFDEFVLDEMIGNLRNYDEKLANIKITDIRSKEDYENLKDLIEKTKKRINQGMINETDPENAKTPEEFIDKFMKMYASEIDAKREEIYKSVSSADEQKLNRGGTIIKRYPNGQISLRASKKKSSAYYENGNLMIKISNEPIYKLETYYKNGILCFSGEGSEEKIEHMKANYPNGQKAIEMSVNLKKYRIYHKDGKIMLEEWANCVEGF